MNIESQKYYYAILFIKSSAINCKGQAIIFKKKTVQSITKLINQFDLTYLHTSINKTYVYKNEKRDVQFVVKYTNNFQQILDLIDIDNYKVKLSWQKNCQLVVNRKQLKPLESNFNTLDKSIHIINSFEQQFIPSDNLIYFYQIINNQQININLSNIESNCFVNFTLFIKTFSQQFPIIDFSENVNNKNQIQIKNINKLYKLLGQWNPILQKWILKIDGQFDF